MQTVVKPSVATQPAKAQLMQNLKLISPIVASIRTVFKTMVATDVGILEPRMKTAGDGHNVFGIIGFSGQLTGTVTLSFTRATAEKIVEAFTGTWMAADSLHFADAIGELANMVAGSAKSKIGLDANITVPSVIIGDRCHVATLSSMPCIVVPCTSPIGDFAVEVCVKEDVRSKEGNLK